MKTIITSLLLLTGSFCFSQTKENIKKDTTKTRYLKEVVVTATRTKKKIENLPVPIVLIKREDIQRTNNNRLSEVLEEYAGISTQEGGGGTHDIQLQGLNGEYILFLIDGEPIVGRNSGGINIERLTASNIERIEIVKGASSSLYGSDAIGGVINIITKKPDYGFQGNAAYRIGSFNTHDANLNLGYKKDKFRVSAFVNRYSTKGYDLTPELFEVTRGAFNNYTIGGKIGYKITSNTDALLSTKYYSSERNSRSHKGGDNKLGLDNVDEISNFFKLTHKFNNYWKAEGQLYITDYKSKSIEHIFETGELDDKGFLNHNFLRPEFKIYFTPNKQHNAILGFGTTSEKVSRDDIAEQKLSAQFVYGQYDATFGKLNVILGARYDNTKNFSSQFSPKLAASYKISDEVKIQGSIGSGFKAPDVRQLYFDWPRSNDHILGYYSVTAALAQYQNDMAQTFVPASDFTGSLNPERSVSYNLGLTYNPTNHFSADINFFRNNIKDMIVRQTIAVLNSGFRLRASNNVSSAYTEGVEINTRIKVSDKVQFNLGYQYLDAVDNDALSAFKNGEVTTMIDGEEITLTERDYKGMFDRSKHMFTAKLFYELSQYGLDMNLRASLKSDYGYEDNDTNGNGYYDTYDVSILGLGLVDYAINKKIGKSLTLGAGVDNIFDYTDPLNNQFIGGRIFYTKLNYSF